MFLVIGEKPSVSQALAKILKAGKKEDGYLSGEDCLVSWCFGHLAEYAPRKAMTGGMQSGHFRIYPLSRRNGSWPWQRIRRHSLQS